jgi:hypothetical protein
MHALDHLDEMKWEQPDHYFGYSPIGDYIVAVRGRDSGALDNSNYETAFKCLSTTAEPFGEPPDVPRDHINYGWGGEGNDNQWVYDFRASCSMTGWVEYLLVRADAPEEVLQEAAEIFCSLKEYPVLDDSDYDERLTAEVERYWKSCSLSSRLDEWEQAYSDIDERWRDSNYFVIRHDDAYLRDDHLFDRLKEGL